MLKMYEVTLMNRYVTYIHEYNRKQALYIANKIADRYNTCVKTVKFVELSTRKHFLPV